MKWKKTFKFKTFIKFVQMLCLMLDFFYFSRHKNIDESVSNALFNARFKKNRTETEPSNESQLLRKTEH